MYIYIYIVGVHYELYLLYGTTRAQVGADMLATEEPVLLLDVPKP